jgi:nucleoside-diphosphate-sugar epimerase
VKRVLVTGAAGRLGHAVLTHLAAHGVAATGLDRIDADDTQSRPAKTTADRMVIGDVADPAVVRDALDGVDGVIHLAAIPAPTLGTPEEVFGRNSLATFVVLEAAGQAGVERAVLASSQSILGLAFAPAPLAPLYLPIDAEHPLQVADPYALGKQADEATGVMIARRYPMTVVALRYPLLGGLGDRLPTVAAQHRADPGGGAKNLWAYLEDRDAATAAWLALTVPLSGYHMFHVAAPETLAAEPTDVLLDRFYPEVPRRRAFVGREVPLDLRTARDVLGFQAIHHYVPELA